MSSEMEIDCESMGEDMVRVDEKNPTKKSISSMERWTI